MPLTANMADNAESVREFLHWFRVVRGRSPTTTKTYEWTLNRWVDHLGSTAFRSATPEQVDSFMMRPLFRSGLPGAPATRSQNLVIVSSLYRWLAAHDPSIRNPTVLVGRPKVHNRKPRAIDDDVWRCIWRHALPVERAWLGLGFFTGLRAGELAKMRAEHVDPRTRDIVGFIRKGGNEGHVMCSQMAQLFHERLAPLLPDPEEWLGPLGALAAARQPGESLVPWTDRPHSVSVVVRYGLLGGETDPAVPARRMKAILRRANLHPNLVTPHALRHSFVGNALRMGIPLHIVQRLADHSSHDVTMRYGRSTERMLDEWIGTGNGSQLK